MPSLPFHETQDSQTGNCKQTQRQVAAVQDRNLTKAPHLPHSALCLGYEVSERLILAATMLSGKEKCYDFCSALNIQLYHWKKTSPIKSSSAVLGWFLLEMSMQQFHCLGQTSSSEIKFCLATIFVILAVPWPLSLFGPFNFPCNFPHVSSRRG